MKEFRKRFGDLASDLQSGIEIAIETHLTIVQRTLDIIRSESVASESELDLDFRVNAEAEIGLAQEKIRQILVAVSS
jgi:hypothetical protein